MATKLMDAVENLRLFFNEFNDKSVTADGMDVESAPKYIQIMVEHTVPSCSRPRSLMCLIVATHCR